ncbi:MAG: peptidylprolyl isomerase [Verrucomicrobiaceae bacterium]|nr:peptidylprolyl isomerase [Verrucomicrobiaceae bacterium]
MLEFFRRHRGAFLTVLTVIIILSFSVWGGWKKGRGGFHDDPTETAFTIYGKDYSKSELDRHTRYMRLAYMMQMYDFPSQLSMLSQKYQSQNQVPLDFIFNLIVLQHEMEKNGVVVSDEEATAELKKLPALQNNGAYDAARANMLEENLGSMGFRAPDLLEIMKYKVGLDKLRALVAGNFTPSPLAVTKTYSQQYQTVKASTITFALDDFKKKAEVTDAEIKKYYDEKKDTYKTAEQRAVSYVFFEEPKDLDKLDADKRAKAQNDFGKKVNDFNEATLKPHAKLEMLAAGMKMKWEAAGPFARDTAPDPLKNERDFIAAIFAASPSAHPISDPVRGSKGYYIFSVLKRVEPRQQELAEVKEKVKTTLVAQKAREAMLKAANDARDALQSGLKAGKKIADLVKEQKIALVDLPEFSPSAPSPDMKAGQEVTAAAEKLPQGQLSTPVNTPAGAVLVYVNAKELRKRDDSSTLKQNVQDNMASTEQFQLFQAWFQKRWEEARVKVRFAAA